MHTTAERQKSDQRVALRGATQANHTSSRIAHIDDDPDIRDTVKRILTANGLCYRQLPDRERFPHVSPRG